MITADTITDADLNGLMYSHTFASPTWNAAKAGLNGDRAGREFCAARLEAFAQSWAAGSLGPATYAPSMDKRVAEILNARAASKAGAK